MKVVVQDIDDNSPVFTSSSGSNVTLGVRVNAPVYTRVAQVEAIDPDADAGAVHYEIANVTYFRPR